MMLNYTVEAHLRVYMVCYNPRRTCAARVGLCVCVFGVEGYSVRWQLVHTHVSGQTVTVSLVSFFAYKT